MSRDDSDNIATPGENVALSTCDPGVQHTIPSADPSSGTLPKRITAAATETQAEEWHTEHRVADGAASTSRDAQRKRTSIENRGFPQRFQPVQLSDFSPEQERDGIRSVSSDDSRSGTSPSSDAEWGPAEVDDTLSDCVSRSSSSPRNNDFSSDGEDSTTSNWSFMVHHSNREDTAGTEGVADPRLHSDNGSRTSESSEAEVEENDGYFERIARELGNFNANPRDFIDENEDMSIECLCHILLVLATKIRHKLTYLATEDIVKLAGLLGGTAVPKSTKYFWKKTVDVFAKGMSIHHLCPSCSAYVGIAKELDGGEFQPLQCVCGETIDPKANVKDGFVFIYVSLEQQLINLFEVCGESYDYKETRIKSNVFALEDIFDGDIYKKTVLPDMLSVNFSVDGVPVFKSSKFSVTPLTCTLNEIEPRKRSKFLMLCGLWFGDGKPRDMNAYLTPFVAESIKLRDIGFLFKVNGVSVKKRVQVLLGITDSVQRPVLRCGTQFNGRYGCGLCLHPGIEVPKGGGKTRVYPIKDLHGRIIPTPLRKHDETLQHCSTQEFGMKQKPILSEIPGFDIVEGLDMDYPHAVFYGVTKAHAKLMLDSKYSDRPFSLRSKTTEIDKFLLSIKPSLEISRTPRKISDRLHWKMHEWAIWLYFYSLPTLKMFQKNSEYVRHWALFVEAVVILCKSSILRSDIVYAERCLLKFVEDFPDLYGFTEVSFNVHLMTHLAKSVRNYGCLWTHSSFLYEDFYQELLSCIKSSRGVAIQICDSFRMQWAVKQLEQLCVDHLSPEHKKYLESVLCRKLRSRPSVCSDGVTFLGFSKPVFLQTDEVTALQRLRINVRKGCSAFQFERALVTQQVIHTKSYAKVTKRNSFTVLDKDNNVFEIDSFVSLTINGISGSYALGFYFNKSHKPLINDFKLNHLIVLAGRQQQMAAMRAKDIKEKVTFFDVPQLSLSLACVHPNHIELLT